MRAQSIPVPPWAVGAVFILLLAGGFLLDSPLSIFVALVPLAAASGIALTVWWAIPFLSHSPRKALTVSDYLRWIAPDELMFPERALWPESDEPLDDLVASVRLLGVLAPVVAYENAVGQVVVLDGRRRVRAAALALKARVPVFMLGTQTPEGQALKQLVLNTTGAQWTPEAVQRLVSLLVLMGVPPETIAEATGYPEDAIILWSSGASSAGLEGAI